MAASKSNSRTIPVWVNAGDRAIVLSRMDGEQWELPLFFSAPNGVRAKLLQVLAKGADGKATRNISWELPTKMIERRITKTGDNAGKPYSSVTITEEFLGEWLGQLEVTVRGATSSAVQSTLDAWNPVVANDTITEADSF